MGTRYRLEKRARKLLHIHALLKACEYLNVHLIQSYDQDLTIHRAAQRGFKRLGAIREHIIEEAANQGVSSEDLYEVARSYSAIPTERAWVVSREHRQRIERKKAQEVATETPKPNLHDVWQEQFQQQPSEFVRSSLDKLTKRADISEIIEAIGVTAAKQHITTDSNRMKYIGGILRRKRLAAVLPDRAEADRELNSAMLTLQVYWARETGSTGRLERDEVAEWLKYCTLEEIEAVMWRIEPDNLTAEMGHVVQARKKAKAAEHV